MGTTPSREAISGTLPSALVPALPGVPCPSPLTKQKKVKINCPPGKKSGDTITMVIGGETKSMVIPPNVSDGGSFIWTIEGDWRKVIASTLHTVPGTTIVESKPIIWSSATYFRFDWRNPGEDVGAMLERAQQELLERAVLNECNAVLGININVMVDRSENANGKLIIASMSGTPCVVVSNAYVPGANAMGDNSTLAMY